MIVSVAGIFRLALDTLKLDRHDTRQQETFAAAVGKAVEPALANTVFGVDTAGG